MRLRRSFHVPAKTHDELEAATLAVEETTLRRPPTEPRANLADAPGPSGLPPPMSEQQQQQSQQQQDQQQQVSSRRSQARQDRDLFWSIINSPYRISSHSSRSRSNEVSIPRISHVPAAGVCADPGARRGPRSAADVQRIVEFKRLTRNLRPVPYRSCLTGVMPVTRAVNPGVTLPSEANSSIIVNRYLQTRGRGRLSLQPSPPPIPSLRPRNGRASPQSPVRARRWEEARDRDGEQVWACGVAAPTEQPPRAPPALAHTDENELNNNPAPATAHTEGQVLSSIEEANEEQDATMEVDVVDMGSNTNVALEEEIVAIDLDSNDGASTVILPDEEDARAGAGTSAAGAALHETGGRFAGELRRAVGGDAAVPATSGAGDAAPEHSNHAKRKRRDSDESLEPSSVKEFNQNLLRLLECPVCLEWMEPPMSQCRRGHLVCGRCRARLASCPVCRTTFSSVRNRAMEGVAELLRYPCRHGCGREVRLRRRAPHEASCAARKYQCPAPLCADTPPMPRAGLAHHFQNHHMTMIKVGRRHKFSMKVNSEQHNNWLIFAMDEYFHLKIDVDIRTWGVVVYVSYIGPKCEAKNYTYEVTIDGQHNQRKLVYARTTHSDLESSALNVSRQDCFHLTLDQALNFIRFKNRHCDADKFLDFNLEISKVEPPATPLEESDS